MKKLGIALIGCGNIADSHLKAIQELEEASLIGVYSRSEERARTTAEAYGCQWTTEMNELITRDDVDVVDIITSSGSHAKIAKSALEAGKHVVVEKPLTLSVADADELIELARSKNKVLSVIFQRRFEPNIQAAKAAVDSGHLGKILLIEVRTPNFRTQEYYDSADWRGTYAEDGGALMNQGIHQIDQLVWFGGKLKSVFGKTATLTHQMEAEDLGLAIVTFENGGYGSIMASTSLSPGFAGTIHIFGEKGSILIEGPSITGWHVPGISAPRQEADNPSKDGASDPRNINYLNHKLQLDNVLKSIIKGSPLKVTAEEGRESVRLINAIYQSANTGKEIYFERE
jgi:UDP-N-acetyl-2-amino-2-deoxyglucuronate dehydrogenase